MLTTAWSWLNANALVFFWVGLIAILIFNAWKWRLDYALALQLKNEMVELPQLKSTPRVTFLVAAWNEAAHLTQHIRSICALRYPNKEYVLCAGGRDETYALASEYANDWIKILAQQPGEGKQAALRRGLSQVTGDIVFFTDADSILSDSAFERVLAPLVNEAEAAATGTSEPLLAQQTQSFVMEHWFTNVYVQAHSGRYVSGLLGRNAVLTRQALHDAGDLADPVNSGTDYHLAKQLLAHGYRIRYISQSSVPTFYPTRWRSYTRQQARWLKNVVLHGLRFRAYGEVMSCLLPSLIGLGMLLGAGLALWQGGILLVGWLLIILHVLASRLRYVRFGEIVTGRRFPAYWQLPFTLLADFAMWAWVLFQYVVPAWRRQW